MLEAIDTYDWEEVFKYADGDAIGDCCPGRFSRDDVAEILYLVEGENDGEDWVAVFKLYDGRYATISAGCDYTGWGCQEGGHSQVANTLEEIIRCGLDAHDRSRLGIPDAQDA